MNKKLAKRRQYCAMIGEELRKALNLQKESINKLTYGKCYTSDYEAGEILARKLFDNELV